MSMQNFATRITNFFVNYFTLKDQLVPQAQAEADIREGVSFRGVNIIVLILAIPSPPVRKPCIPAGTSLPCRLRRYPSGRRHT